MCSASYECSLPLLNLLRLSLTRAVNPDPHGENFFPDLFTSEKLLAEELVQKRKKEALLQRSKLKSSREENERLREKLVGGTKTNHDEMYHAKFVPAGSADMFSKSTYGSLVA